MSEKMQLVYDINDKPRLHKNLFYALQQLLAIMAATILVPALVDPKGLYMDQSAALCGAGFGTLFYLFMTQRKSPVFLGSSFAFISPLTGAIAYGFGGVFLGAVFAGLVYILIAVIVKTTGTAWVNKLLPPVVIGPTVALIGLSLCGSAIKNLANLNGDHLVIKQGFTEAITNANLNSADETVSGYSWVHILLGLFAFGITVLVSIKGGKRLRMVPFIIGIVSAYVVGMLLTDIGNLSKNDTLKVINLDAYKDLHFFNVPRFNFLGMFGALDEKITKAGQQVFTLASPNPASFENGVVPEGYSWFTGVLNIFIAFAPVAFVTLAEHIADHKNLSTIINRDLTQDPGLPNTLLGDGGGSIIGSFFGGCPNTTYGESVGCVAITRNASVSTIFLAAIYCIVLSFFGPFTAFVNSIPACITGGVCIALYGFIAVSGLKMLQPVDLNDNRNLFVVAAILVPGIGGLTLKFGEKIEIGSIATALILGVLVNVIFNLRKAPKNAEPAEKADQQ